MTKKYLIILVISLFVSLYLFEGYLTFKDQLSKEQLLKEQLFKEQLYKKQTGNKWDKRDRLDIYKELKKTNNKIVVSLHSGKLRNPLNKNNTILPLSGLSNTNTINCNENGYYSIYQSDRYGFNNPDNEWDSKRSSRSNRYLCEFSLLPSHDYFCWKLRRTRNE